MLRAMLVGADYSHANDVVELLSMRRHATVAGRVDYYPSAMEFGRILREVEPEVVLMSLGDFSRAIELHRLAAQIIPGIQTVGLLRDSGSAVPLEAIREGIREFLEYPLAPGQVDGVFERVGANVAERPPQQAETDLIYAFFPARPGLGASTIAVNTAAALAEIPDVTVLLADFDLHNGVLRLLLNLQSGCSLAEAAMRTGSLDEDIWRQFVHRLGRLDVARAGKPAADTRLEPLQVASLMRFAKRRYKVVCADLPGTLDPESLVVLREASRIFLVTTPEPLSLYMAREDMQALEQLGVGGRVEVILNRYSPKAGREPEVASRTIGAPVVAVVPNDYRSTQYAIRTGQPMAMTSPAGTAVRTFARTLVSGHVIAETEEPRMSLASLFGLKRSQAS